jgi:hypothetical protein
MENVAPNLPRSQSTATRPVIKVVRFQFDHHKDCVGIADVQLVELGIIVRGIRFYIPSDSKKKPYIYFPSQKRGSGFVTAFQFSDTAMDFRYRAYIARAVEAHVLAIKPPSPPTNAGCSRLDSERSAEPPLARKESQRAAYARFVNQSESTVHPD